MYLRDAAVSMREWLSAPLCFFAIKRGGFYGRCCNGNEKKVYEF